MDDRRIKEISLAKRQATHGSVVAFRCDYESLEEAIEFGAVDEISTQKKDHRLAPELCHILEIIDVVKRTLYALGVERGLTLVYVSLEGEVFSASSLKTLG